MPFKVFLFPCLHALQLFIAYMNISNRPKTNLKKMHSLALKARSSTQNPSQ